MLSDNPHAGIYEADTSRTLDTSGCNPACNQGGIAVVALEGNGTRPSHRGSGYSEDGVSFTLNATEIHGIAYHSSKNSYHARRLTPTECARLQGFPDDWTDGIEINGRPMSDSAKYKLWGNGIALNCLIDMMMQMKLVLERDGSTGRR